MNSLIRISILWSLAISIGGAQEADTPKDESSPAVPVPALEQAANEAVSEDDRRIVVVLGPDATPSEDEQAVNIQKAFDSLKARNLLRFSTPEDDPKKVIVTLGFRKEDSAESIENLLIDLWQLDIPGLTVSLRTGATIQIETGDGCYAQISNFEDLDRRQIIDLWEFFQKPERKQKFDALFHSGSHAYSKPSVPPPHPASPSTVSLKVERGLARDAIEITRSLEKKGGLVSLGVDEEANAILVDSRDGFIEEARVLLKKWQDFYHPVRISDGKAGGAEPKSVSASNIEAGSGSSKAIVLVIDADAQKSEVVKEVIAALEKAGIATGKAAETTSPANSSIRVTLRMRRDESYEKIKLLVEALRNAGVQQIAVCQGGTQYEGKEHNSLDIQVQPGYSPAELQKIEFAAITVRDQHGLSLLVGLRGLPGESERRRSPDDANFRASDSSEQDDPAMDSASSRNASEIADLRTKYEAANKQAHDLATLLRDRSGGRVDDQLKAQNEQKIEKSLQQKVSLHFRNAPFTEVIREISKSHGINIVMKTREIGTEGLPTGRPISIDVEEITLGSALTLLLDQAGGLEYHIENEVLMITNGGEPKPAVDDDVENIDNMAAKKAELRTAVRRAFTLRQSLLRAELQEMQARLEKTQQSLDMRDRIAEQIVDRRVENLLNPQLNWDSDVVPDQPLTQSVSPDAPTNRLPAAADPKAAMRAKLQGTWVLDGTLDGSRILAEVRDNVMTWSVDTPLEPGDGKPPIFLIKLDDPGKPQAVDLTMNPNDGQDRVELPGIIEFGDDMVRICVNMGGSGSGDATRPEVFANGKAAELWTFRRPAKTSSAFLGVLLDPAPVGPDQLKDTPFRGGLRIKKVYAGTPAAEGGLLAEDILVGLGAWEIAKLEDLLYALGLSLEGEVSFHILRDGQVRKGDVLLDGSERPASDAGLTPDQLTKIPVEVQRGHSTPANLSTPKLPSADPKIAIVALLQGKLTVETTVIQDGKTTVSKPITAVGEGIRVQFASEDGKPPMSFEFILGAAGPPQQVDLRPIPMLDTDEISKKGVPKELFPFLEAEMMKQIPLLPGIVEVDGDCVRVGFAAEPEKSKARPTEFKAGPSSVTWEFRPQAAAAKTTTSAATTELEGDWHKVEHLGHPVQSSDRCNLTLRGDVWTESYSNGKEVICRLRVDAQEKRLSLKSENRDSEVDYRYAIEGSRLLLRLSGQLQFVFERGLDPSIHTGKAAGVPADAMPKVRLDPILEQLQGRWSYSNKTFGNSPEQKVLDESVKDVEVNIQGDLMTAKLTFQDGSQIEQTQQLKLGEAGPPQQIDVIVDPNGGVTREVMKGIIEINKDLVRICRGGTSETDRPKVFAVSSDVSICELRRKPALGAATELEGDWHGVAYYDHEGKPQETLPSNRSFRGDQSSFVRPGYRHDCRIKVDPIKKTLWSYSKEEDGSFTQDYYELKGNQLILRNEPGAVGYQVFERGLVRTPSVVPPATLEQKLLWRSAIVDIAVYPHDGTPRSDKTRIIGRGAVISSDGQMLSQLPVVEGGDLSKEKFSAKFDDGSNIPLKLIEETGQGWCVLQPEQPIDVNHFFEVSTTEVQLHDEVRVWGPDHSQAGSESLAPFANTVSALDRKYPALGIAVWQLRIGHRPVPGTPILDADGDLLGMTITGARDLLLAIPVAELKTMFPKSFGQPSESEPQPVEALPDWLSELQGTWTVTDSPIKVDENSGGQMKEIRIDRDQWSIVWTAKPGDPDRLESLRVVRPDEKNLYAIDLVEPSTGKVVYPSLYELDQAGLTFCYGYRGERPREISTGNVAVTIRLKHEK